MNAALRNGTGREMTKKVGGQILTFVRNAGGPAKVPGSGIPFPPGPKQFQQLKNWTSAGVWFGATGFTALCYFTDWRVVTDWIPFYNGKYKD